MVTEKMRTNGKILQIHVKAGFCGYIMRVTVKEEEEQNLGKFRNKGGFPLQTEDRDADPLKILRSVINVFFLLTKTCFSVFLG